MTKEIKEEMFLEIYIPNLLLKHLEKLSKHTGVESYTKISEDINGTTYKFVGYFDPQTLVKRIKHLYQKEYDLYNKRFGVILQKELKKLRKEGLLGSKDTDGQKD